MRRVYCAVAENIHTSLMEAVGITRGGESVMRLYCVVPENMKNGWGMEFPKREVGLRRVL